MTTPQGVQLILDDLGLHGGDDDFLVTMRMGIVSPQRVPASVALAGLDRDQPVHLLDRHPRAAVPLMTRMPSRRPSRGSALSRRVPARRGRRRRRLGPAAASPLAAGQLLLQRCDPHRLVFHDPLELYHPHRPLPQADEEHLHRRRGALPVAVGNRNLRGSFHEADRIQRNRCRHLIPRYQQTPKIGQLFLNMLNIRRGLNGYYPALAL